MASIPDEYDELEERVSREFAEAWIPTPEVPTITGTFVRLDQAATNYGPCRVVVLRTKDGSEKAVWLFHTALKAAFAREKPKAGDLVAVRWLGKRQGSAGQTYDGYRVAVKRDQAEADWDALGSDEPVDSHDWSAE